MNIASDEDSSLDVTVTILADNKYHLVIRHNEDILGDTIIDYTIDANDLDYFIGYLQEKLKGN
jgi:hypothetical protein